VSYLKEGLFLNLRSQALASPWEHRAGNWRGWSLIKTISKMDYLVSCAAENIMLCRPGPAPPVLAGCLLAFQAPQTSAGCLERFFAIFGGIGDWDF